MSFLPGWRYIPTSVVHQILLVDAVEVGKMMPGLVPELIEERPTRLFSYIGDVAVRSHSLRKRLGLRFWRNAGISEWVCAFSRENIELQLIALPVKHELPRSILISFENNGQFGLRACDGLLEVSLIPRWSRKSGTDVNQDSITYHEQAVVDGWFGCPIDDCYSNLGARLQEMSVLSRSLGRGDFCEVFDNANRALDGIIELTAYAGGLLSEQAFSPEARHLLEVVGRAWVFGGMGSWNDIQPDDGVAREEFNEITMQFYSAIENSILAAVNFGRITRQ